MGEVTNNGFLSGGTSSLQIRSTESGAPAVRAGGSNSLIEQLPADLIVKIFAEMHRVDIFFFSMLSKRLYDILSGKVECVEKESLAKQHKLGETDFKKFAAAAFDSFKSKCHTYVEEGRVRKKPVNPLQKCFTGSEYRVNYTSVELQYIQCIRPVRFKHIFNDRVVDICYLGLLKFDYKSNFNGKDAETILFVRVLKYLKKKAEKNTAVFEKATDEKMMELAKFLNANGQTVPPIDTKLLGKVDLREWGL